MDSEQKEIVVEQVNASSESKIRASAENDHSDSVFRSCLYSIIMLTFS